MLKLCVNFILFKVGNLIMYPFDVLNLTAYVCGLECTQGGGFNLWVEWVCVFVFSFFLGGWGWGNLKRTE